MARNMTTKVFRERAVSMVIAGKSEQQVATELGIEVHKIRRWYNNAMNATAEKKPELFDVKVQKVEESETSESPKELNEAEMDMLIDKEAENKRLQQENKYLKELIHLSTQWISTYIAMQSENHTGL